MSTLKKILIGIILGVIGIIAAILLLIVNIFSLVTGLKPNGAVSSTKSYDATMTAIYQSAKEVDTEFVKIVNEQMQIERKKLIDENTYEVEETDPETGKMVIKKKCDITVKRIVNHINYADLLAYLTTTGGLDEKTGQIDQTKALDYLKSIYKIEITQIADKKYEIQNAFITEDDIADKYFTKDTEKKKFIASCHAYGLFFKYQGANTVNDDALENPLPDDALNISLLEMPLYLQYSGSWSNVAYGNGTIKNKGCAPTCLAMVLSYMKQQSILPSDIVAFTGNRYYVNGAGSSWDIFPAVASNWGVSCRTLGHSQSNMLAALSAGKPVIASMGPGTFTSGGHFIVLTGLTADGKITVNDPNDSSKKNHKGTSFDVSLIMRESKSFWSFE